MHMHMHMRVRPQTNIFTHLLHLHLTAPRVSRRCWFGTCGADAHAQQCTRLFVSQKQLHRCVYAKGRERGSTRGNAANWARVCMLGETRMYARVYGHICVPGCICCVVDVLCVSKQCLPYCCVSMCGCAYTYACVCVCVRVCVWVCVRACVCACMPLPCRCGGCARTR